MAVGLEGIIEHLERQRAAIEQALSALRGVEGISSAPVAHHSTGNAGSSAQRARWAAMREVTPPQKRGGLTAAGRKRLAENMKKRWAAKRTAAQAKKRR
jgi:hypothetical protein